VTPEPDTDGNAVRIDAGKTRLDLLDPEFLEGVADSLEYGAMKYYEWSWLKGWQYHRPYASVLRHLLAWFKGEERDPETVSERFPEGIHHLHMAAAQLMFLTRIATHSKYDDLDNRPEL